MDNFQEDCERNINLDAKGAIVYQSTLTEKTRNMNVDWNRLFSIIEDNIYPADAPDGNEEVIVWWKVWREYTRTSAHG
jgi:hypothetical protein